MINFISCIFHHKKNFFLKNFQLNLIWLAYWPHGKQLTGSASRVICIPSGRAPETKRSPSIHSCDISSLQVTTSLPSLCSNLRSKKILCPAPQMLAMASPHSVSCGLRVMWGIHLSKSPCSRLAELQSLWVIVLGSRLAMGWEEPLLRQNSRTFPRLPLPGVTSLYNTLPLSISGTCEHNGVSPLWLCHIMWQGRHWKGDHPGWIQKE